MLGDNVFLYRESLTLHGESVVYLYYVRERNGGFEEKNIN